MSKLTANGSLLLAVIAFSAGGLFTKTLNSQPALAQQAAAASPASIGWEYATVMGVNQGMKGPHASICYFRTTGAETETIELDKGHPRDALAIAIAKLGQEGWEMMGEGKNIADGSSYIGSLYFKRPKR